MSLTLIVNHCICKNGRKPPSALVGDISSQILIIFIKGQIFSFENLWRHGQQDCFFFPRVLLQVFFIFIERVVSLPWTDSVQVVGVAACSHSVPPRGAEWPCSSPRCPGPSAAPGWGKEAPSTSCPSCLHCHLLLRGSWRPSTNCIPWPSTSCQSVQLPLLTEQLPLLERLEVGKGQGEEAIFTFVSLQQLTMGATIQGRCYSAILIFSLFPRIVRFQQLGS